MRVPILMYHQITPRPDPAYSRYAITPSVFAAQMQWLAENDFVPVRLDDFVADRPPAVPGKPVIITFDDGFQDCVDHAIPILQARGFTATFFLVAGLVGGTSRWLAHERGLEYPLMDWPAARALLDAGFDCGAHSMTHPRLATLARDACRRELRDSRALLEDKLGRVVHHVAYPFGSFSRSVGEVAAECGFISGCTVEPGVAVTYDDPLALRRLHVIAAEGLSVFADRLQQSPGLSTSACAPRPEPVPRTLAGETAGDRCLASVVIPTYQRRESVTRTLDALARQSVSSDEYEVIVSVDGSTDGTCEMLASYAAPYQLRAVHGFPKAGRATACNRGIRQSRGEVIVILDDDMEPGPTFLQSHLCQHVAQTSRLALGPVPISFDERSSAVVRYVGSKFNKHLDKLARPGWPIGCRDFYSGNCSARREVLLGVGLFDESFTVYGNEDVEWGLRLVAGGVELVYAPDAVARQHYEKSVERLAADEAEKGRSAVLLATKHPDCIPYLKLSSYRSGSRKWRMARGALIQCSRLLPLTRRIVLDGLRWLERRGDKEALDRYFPLFLDYFFWEGASAALREAGISAASLQGHVGGPRG